MDNRTDLYKKALCETMKAFVRFCEDNNLRYYACGGTCLGAIRHKGMLPWDDDIDILMPREDYTKLLEIWSEIAPEDYILQEPYSSSDITNNFVKIRKNHTTFMQTEAEKKCKYHKGIFIDIFPLEGTSGNSVAIWLKHKVSCFLMLVASSVMEYEASKQDNLYKRLMCSTKKGTI